jgi:hypothetical protein
VGLLTIVSALTPSMASRSEMIESVLPPVVPEAARLAALGSGLGLIWLSHSLGRRQQRAWLLAAARVDEPLDEVSASTRLAPTTASGQKKAAGTDGDQHHGDRPLTGVPSQGHRATAVHATSRR